VGSLVPSCYANDTGQAASRQVTSWGGAASAESSLLKRKTLLNRNRRGELSILFIPEQMGRTRRIVDRKCKVGLLDTRVDIVLSEPILQMRVMTPGGVTGWQHDAFALSEKTGRTLASLCARLLETSQIS
jgi:hypothetical protein